MRSLGVAIGFLLLLSSCSERPSIQRSADDPFLTVPSHVAYNVKIAITDSTRSKATLYARQGNIDERNQRTTMVGNVIVDFYEKSGVAVQARLTADSVVVNDITKDMTAHGNVRVESRTRQITLTTTLLTWVNATRRVQTEKPVHIETGSESIDGVGFESNQDLSSYRLFHVRGVRRKS
ncbi:MAG: LPS export ABC transporter periplasmic protein LptC [Ignavibacteria bacterium]|jgi:LPS export ABC transporter protein LptC